MKKATNNICPRCTHLVPSDDVPGEYPGAMSRFDNDTEVCSDCGADEAYGRGIVPANEWPIEHISQTDALGLFQREGKSYPRPPFSVGPDTQ